MDCSSRTRPVLFSLLILVFPLSNISQPQDSLLPPDHLLALSNFDSQIPLFWFPPGTKPEELSYDDGTHEYSGYIHADWKQNQAAVKYRMADLPAYLTSVKIFLVNTDLFPQLEGNQNSPFLLSVNRDSSRVPGRLLWGPDTLQADSGAWDSLGQWLEVPIDLFVHTDSAIWIVFYWLEQTPTAPRVGLDTTSTGQNSYNAQFNGEILDWTIYGNLNLMIRLEVLTNSSQSLQISPADSFNLYRGADSANVFNPSNHWRSLPFGSSHTVDNSLLNGMPYFYAITALYAGQESAPEFSRKAVPRTRARLTLFQTFKEIETKFDTLLFDTVQIANLGDLPLELSYKLQLLDSLGIQISDNWGYTWKSNSDSADLTFDWIDIEQPGNFIAQNFGDDVNWGPYPLGFSFPFYGNSFDSLRICSNGFISFTSPSIERSNTTLPNAGGRFNLVAPFWDDLVLNDSSEIYFKSTGDTAVISFLRLGRYGASANYSFQVILNSQGNIAFQYLDLFGPTDSATLGIQNQNGSDALLIAYNRDFLEDSMIVAISAPWLELEDYPIQLLVGQTQDLLLKVNSGNLELGQHFAQVVISGEDSAGLILPQKFQLTLDVTTSSSVGDQNLPIVPGYFSLAQNFPNPFNQSTQMRYSLLKSGLVSLKIYNLRGELVTTLVKQFQPAGNHEVAWNGKNSQGENVSSGLYFYQLRVGDQKQTRKLTLLK